LVDYKEHQNTLSVATLKFGWL